MKPTKWQKKVVQSGDRWLRERLKTAHGRIVLCGLLVGLCYLPAWLGGLFVSAGQGSSGLPLVMATVYLGLNQLWKQRRQLALLIVPDEDRLLGHILILAGAVLFPFCRFAIWPQTMLWLVVLAGLACSCWGASFFKKYPLPVILMVVCAYPNPGVTARLIWQTITPPKILEQLMAFWGASALSLMGQPALAKANYIEISDAAIELSARSVEVGWACNGFNLAFTTAAIGLTMGLFYKQTWLKVTSMMFVGILLALVFNVPRIMLLTLAHVYWGENAFRFWHGPVGGQLFAGVLFTAYYYAVMAIVKRKVTRLSS